MEIIGRGERLSKSALKKYSAVIVGSGLFGSTVAERITNSMNQRVLVVEKRNHFGGNLYSAEWENTGIPVHLYGPHIFHTSNKAVWDYVTNFADFNNYRHHVWAKTREGTLPLPISLATLAQLWDTDLSPDEAKLRLRELAVVTDRPKNFEEKALSLIGEDLYRLFFEGYTTKQWGVTPRDLPASIFSRLPVRFNRNTAYFSDTWEGIPTDGYSELIARMLANDNIHLALETNWNEIKEIVPSEIPVVFTGPIDEFFDFEFGQLGWRTIDFEFRVEPTSDYQGCSQMNYPEVSIPFTREVEYKHFHPENRRIRDAEMTVVGREYSRQAKPGDDVYYPINSREDREKLELYRQRARELSGVYFGGRLGSYQYLDMHMAIASALTFFHNNLQPEMRKFGERA